MITMEQGINELMAILEGNGGVKVEEVPGLGGAHVQPTKSTKVVAKPEPESITYDGYGHIIAKNDKPVAVGPKKRRTAAKSKNHTLKTDLMDAVQVLLSKVKAFEGKVGKNSVDGVVIRLSDADYTVKLMGHAKREFENREEDFVPTKSYITRGKAVNHAPAIAKIIAGEFENQNPVVSFAGFENENPNLFSLLESKASGVRFEVSNTEGIFEMTFKITKKRSRVCMD